MRVLQINSVCGIGSTGRIATDIHEILLEQGYESYIAYGRGKAHNCDNTIRIGNELDNYFHVALTRIFDKHGFGSRRATKKFIEEVKKLDPDIIHLHNIHGYYINIEILFDYLKEVQKPVVWTLHDCWSFTGHCAYFDYVGCNKWQTGCRECPQKDSYPKSIFVDNSKWNYKKKREIFTGLDNLTIVTPSHWLANIVRESFLRDYKIEVVHNGIDLEVFKPRESDFRSRYNLGDRFIILGVANIWDRRKGLEYFIELNNSLSEDEQIVLVGLTEKQIKSLPANIVGISRTQDVIELAEIYSAADVFLNPTLEEVLGLVNLEAQACGTPVITFDTGGSPEAVDKKTGYIVKQGDLTATVKIIKKLRKNEFEKNNVANTEVKKLNISKLAFKDEYISFVNDRFNKIDRYNDYLALYQENRK